MAAGVASRVGALAAVAATRFETVPGRFQASSLYRRNSAHSAPRDTCKHYDRIRHPTLMFLS